MIRIETNRICQLGTDDVRTAEFDMYIEERLMWGIEYTVAKENSIRSIFNISHNDDICWQTSESHEESEKYTKICDVVWWYGKDPHNFY
jgi:hypothetical protein